MKLKNDINILVGSAIVEIAFKKANYCFDQLYKNRLAYKTFMHFSFCFRQCTSSASYSSPQKDNFEKAH